ncbi:head-tail connector protein [Streptomyces sp. NBC_00996]|uniref:head-tail connector protein n=1 Tax=Streptomyces sp. NBC_00996 TaxID=2903710 RepID=UPI003864D3FB|nr:phage gp6-like head-tail connector protein [Streptomyces sp. NBC_00996]
MAIITLEQAKAQLNIDATDTSDDAELQLYMDAVTGALEEYKHQVIEQREFTEDIRVTSIGSFRLFNTPVVSLTSVEAADGSQTWDVANLRAAPSGVVRVLSGLLVTGLITVVYTAGPATVAANYQLAGLIVLQHLWETRRGRYGTVPGGGEAVIPAGYALPNRAIELLGVPTPVVA